MSMNRGFVYQTSKFLVCTETVQDLMHSFLISAKIHKWLRDFTINMGFLGNLLSLS